MIDAESYLAAVIKVLQDKFGDRLQYVGLQGSYLRGEATQDSDIDLMVVLDRVDMPSLDAYREAVCSVGSVEKACGFLCGKEELRNWNALEACHVLHTTKDYYGSLEPLLPPFCRADVYQFVKLSLNNLYHELCHRYIYGGREKSAAKLAISSKSVFFILQNSFYLETGAFVRTKWELLQKLQGPDREVLALSLRLQKEQSIDFDADFSLLLSWCQRKLVSITC